MNSSQKDFSFGIILDPVGTNGAKIYRSQVFNTLKACNVQECTVTAMGFQSICEEFTMKQIRKEAAVSCCLKTASVEYDI